jgi:hypothetical protein
MLNMKINQAKTFFDSKKVTTPAERAELSALRKMGAYIRTTARRSMRKARMKKVSELSDDERRSYDIRVAKWQQGGREGRRPRRPLAPSRPGEPPRTITGYIRKFLFFVVDKRKRNVVVGPAKINRPSVDALQALEFGGRSKSYDGDSVQIKARPFMRPALKAEQGKFQALFADAIR